MDIIWIIAGIALYWLVVTALDFLGVFEGTNLDTAGPLFLIRTYRGRKFLERLSRRRRFWRIYGNLGIAVAVTVMALVFVFLLYVGFVSVVSPPQPSSLTQPQNLVVVPGVNEFLPLSVAFEIVMGLAIGIIVHEGGHGVMCKANDIGVSSMGLVSFAVLPVGAFVEPDEDEVEEADSGSRTRMFAAGVMNNFVITIAAFVLIALLLFSVQPIDGVGVKSVENGSLAGKADIEGGDVVKSVNGEPVDNVTEFVRVTQNSTRNVTLTVYSDGETSTETLSLNRTMGVEVKYALEGYPAAKAGLQEGDVITRIGNRTVTNFTTFSSALSGREANETVEVEYLRDGNATVVTVTLANRRGDQGGFLGVAYYTPVEKLGIAPYDIGAVYSLLSSLNPVNWIASVYLPFAGALGGSSFFGFEGTVAEFYRLGGIASLLGGFYWTLINIVYWTAWINFNLGIFNCVPAIPLDGGHIFREGAKKALRPVKDEERRERFAGYAAGGLALVMFGSMLMMIIAPRFLR